MEMMRENSQQRKNNPPQTEPQKCPRCDSVNTKFCYYNNYSLSQPRYYCKTCRRYWTHGGTLRNVPVGGGSRKAKRAKTVVPSPAPPLPPLPPTPPQPPADLAGGHFPSFPSFGASSAVSLLQGFGDISGGSFPSNIQLGGLASSAQDHHHWPSYPQSFGNYGAVWNIGNQNASASTSGPSLRPNQWPDLPRSYGSPPP